MSWLEGILTIFDPSKVTQNNNNNTMSQVTAQDLNIPQEVFDLFSNSVVVGRMSHNFTLKHITKSQRVNGQWQVIERTPYIQLNATPTQIGSIKDLGLNSLIQLMRDHFEYQGQLENGVFRFVKPRIDYTEDQMEIINASAANALTYSPEQIIDIIDTPEGETMVHHYGEEQFLRRAVKNKLTGAWTWEVLMTKEDALNLPVVPAGVRVVSKTQLARYANNKLTSEQFDNLAFEERKLVDIDTSIDVANVFTKIVPSEGKLKLDVLFNNVHINDKPISEYTATPTGWWNYDFRAEWKLFNEQPLPDVLNDGVLDMRDTAAGLSEVGNFGMIAKVHFPRNAANLYEIGYREITAGEVPHYNPSYGFAYDPSKKCVIMGSIRILPLNGGKEATHECYFVPQTGEVTFFMP